MYLIEPETLANFLKQHTLCAISLDANGTFHVAPLQCLETSYCLAHDTPSERCQLSEFQDDCTQTLLLYVETNSSVG